MISAWGVDHGISKSYVPGKGWVSASQAGKKTLHAARKGGNRYSGMRGVSERDKTALKSFKSMEDTSNLRTTKTVDLGRGRKVEQKHSGEMPVGVEAFAYMQGKRRIVVTKPGADPKFVKHELAHVTPKKRKAHRLAQISADPKKAMREEARADMAGGMPWRKAPSKQEVTRGALSGDSQAQYSGYAGAARRRGMARDQRNVGRVSDFVNRRAAKQEGMNPAMLPKRSKMFKQPAMGEYRKVQDKIDRAHGKTHRFTAENKNAINRGADVAIPATAIGGAGYYGHRKHQQRQKVKKNIAYQYAPMTAQEQRRHRRNKTASGAASTGFASAALTAAMNPINRKNLKGAAGVGALASGLGAGLSYHGAKKKQSKLVPVRYGSRS